MGFALLLVSLLGSMRRCREHASLWQVIIADVGEKDSPYEELLSVLPASDCRYGGGPCGKQAHAPAVMPHLGSRLLQPAD